VEALDLKIFNGRRVLVTGHTGFKGAWLSLWLLRLGARVTGIALPPDGERNLWRDLRLDDQVRSIEHDIRDADGLASMMKSDRPEIVFHLAAQSLVRRGYDEPRETFETNVTGTLNVLQAAHACDARAAIVVTSDKCYAHSGVHAERFREDDALGGDDPYSASKACAEIVTGSFRSSYAMRAGMILASARAGNVIGGGDWSADRLVPDVMRASIAKSVVDVRNPASIRPWQHVLESLQGYLCIGARALNGDEAVARAWNFGPDSDDEIPVSSMLALLAQYVPFRWKHVPASDGKGEAQTLRLDSSLARAELAWKPKYRVEQAVQMTAAWYQRALTGEDAASITREQIDAYAA
jgi:CDP-glucose 4,6-dehydratase